MAAPRYLLIVFALSLVGCQQSGSSHVRDLASPLAPSSVPVKPALSDPIRIVSGTLSLDPPSGQIDLQGTSGFALSSRVSVTGGIFQPFNQCSGTLACVPGASVSLDAYWSDSDLPSTIRLRGKTVVTGLGAMSAHALVDFKGTITLPAFTPDGRLEASAPFTFTGVFKHYPDGVEPGVTEPLDGHGVARVRFVRDSSTGTAWVFEEANYEFTPSTR